MQGTSCEIKGAKMSNKNYVFIVLIVLFVIGMVYGTLIVKSKSYILLEKLTIITNDYVSIHANQPLINTFANTFFSIAIFILVPYLLGYSSIGQLPTLLIPLFKGLGLGSAMGQLYASYGLKGIGYSALIIIPQTVISLFAIIVACRESIKLSNLLFYTFASKQGKDINLNTIKLYNIKFLILCVIALVASIVSALSVFLFSGMFNIN